MASPRRGMIGQCGSGIAIAYEGYDTAYRVLLALGCFKYPQTGVPVVSLATGCVLRVRRYLSRLWYLVHAACCNCLPTHTEASACGRVREAGVVQLVGGGDSGRSRIARNTQSIPREDMHPDSPSALRVVSVQRAPWPWLWPWLWPCLGSAAWTCAVRPDGMSLARRYVSGRLGAPHPCHWKATRHRLLQTPITLFPSRHMVNFGVLALHSHHRQHCHQRHRPSLLV